MAKKRANGEGTIVKNMRNGIQVGWRASISIGRKPDGKPIRKEFTGKTQKEVKEKLEEYKRKMSLGILNQENITLENWCHTWLFTYKIKQVKPGTFLAYESIYRNYIENTEIGRIKLGDLKTPHIQKYYNNLLEVNKITTKTLKRINRLISSCLTDAEKQGYILKNWCNSIILPKVEEKKEIVILTKEEQSKFTEALKGHNLELLFLMALGTGMRKGELLALKWSDIDFKNSEVSVSRTLQRIRTYENGEWKKNTLLEQSTKTKTSTRVIPIPQNLMLKIKEYKKKQNEKILFMGSEYHNNNYIFCNELGDPLCESTPWKALKTLLKKLDMKPIEFHALRHTYATRLFEAGVQPKTVQHLMGHSSIKMTLDIYTHVMPKEKINAVEKINNLFS